MIQQTINQLLRLGAQSTPSPRPTVEETEGTTQVPTAASPQPAPAPAAAPTPAVPTTIPTSSALGSFQQKGSQQIDQRESFRTFVDDLRARKQINHSAYEQIKEALKKGEKDG